MSKFFSALFVSAVFFGLPTSQATESKSNLDRVAVVVDDGVILQSEIDQRIADVRYQFQQRQNALPPDDLLRKQVIDQMVLESLQLNLAQRAGIRIDDNELNRALSDIAQRNGLGLVEFQKKLDATEGSSYADVREQVKRELIINQLRTRYLQDRIKISDQDVQNFLRSPSGQAELATEYRLGHIMIRLPDNPEPADISAAEAKATTLKAKLSAGADFAQLAAANSGSDTALKGGDLGWRKAAELPSVFVAEAEKLVIGDVSAPIRTPSGIHLIKLFAKRGGNDMKVKQWQTVHILVKPTEILSSDEARLKLEDIRNRIEKGQISFSDAARTYSDDPGSARQGGDLGWVNAGEMVPAFDKIMRDISPNQISAVFQSNFGWHILKVTGVRDQDVSAQYQTAQAKQALFERAYDEELASWLRELRGMAYVEVRD